MHSSTSQSINSSVTRFTSLYTKDKLTLMMGLLFFLASFLSSSFLEVSFALSHPIQEADLGLGPFAITEPRWRVVAYSQPVAHTDLRIMASVGSLEIDPWAFLLPLTPALWGLLVATLVLVWGATLLVGHLGQAWRQWPHSVFLQLYGALMQQGEDSRTLADSVHKAAG